MPLPQEKTFRITGTTGATRILDGGELGFLARSLYVDNPTNQWLEVSPYGHVAPYTLSAILPLGGAQRISVRNAAPPSVVAGTIFAEEGPIIAIATEAILPPSPGFPIGTIQQGRTFALLNVANPRPIDGTKATSIVTTLVLALVTAFTVKAPITNPDTLWIRGFSDGAVTTNDYPLEPGASIDVDGCDLRNLAFAADVANVDAHIFATVLPYQTPTY